MGLFGKKEQEEEPENPEPERTCAFQGNYDDDYEEEFNCDLTQFGCDKDICPFWR